MRPQGRQSFSSPVLLVVKCRWLRDQKKRRLGGREWGASTLAFCMVKVKTKHFETHSLRMLRKLDLPRGRDSWCWPKGTLPLGTRMFKTEYPAINLAETFWLNWCRPVAKDEKLIVKILTDNWQSMICSVSFELTLNKITPSKCKFYQALLLFV